MASDDNGEIAGLLLCPLIELLILLLTCEKLKVAYYKFPRLAFFIKALSSHFLFGCLLEIHLVQLHFPLVQKADSISDHEVISASFVPCGG